MPIARRSFVAGIALLPLAASCSATDWRRVDLGDRTPTQLTNFGDGCLVGSVGARLSLIHGRTVTDLPVRGRSPYADQARWRSISTRGEEIIAIGESRGGAHANSRWTVWRGNPAGLIEEPQSFDVFHGWGSGQLSGAGWVEGRPTLIGSWQSDAAGLDLATWQARGVTWERRPSSGTALANSTSQLGQARTVVTLGEDLVIAGQVTELGPELAVRPALWRSSPSGWTRRLLPAIGNASAESIGAGIVLGREGRAVRFWASDSALPNLPDPVRTVPETATLPAPIGVAGQIFVLVPHGAGSLLLHLPETWTAGQTWGPGPAHRELPRLWRQPRPDYLP